MKHNLRTIGDLRCRARATSLEFRGGFSVGAGGLEPPYPQNRNGFPLSAVFTADDEAAKAREQRVAADMRYALLDENLASLLTACSHLPLS